MPVRDWTKVDAGIFHAFHHRWISALSDALNQGVLPAGYYALAEQRAGGLGPDVLTLQGGGASQPNPSDQRGTDGGVAVALARPKLQPTAVTDLEYYRRKQDSLVVRHVSGDRMVAVIEILSPGNKSTTHAFRGLIEKAGRLLENGIHLLLIDLFPPGPRDPQGVHAAVWEAVSGEAYLPPREKSLTTASYEAGLALRAYVRHFAVGDEVPDMPLFLQEDGCVEVPLERTAESAFAVQPARWRRVLDSPAAQAT